MRRGLSIPRIVICLRCLDTHVVTSALGFGRCPGHVGSVGSWPLARLLGPEPLAVSGRINPNGAAIHDNAIRASS